MTGPNRSLDDEVLAAWAPAGWGRIVVVLGQGVVIHKVIVSGRAAAAGVAEAVGFGVGEPAGDRDVVVADAAELRRSPFVDKVLRNGVPGLLASPRKTLLLWDEIVSAEYRSLALNRGRMIIRTAAGSHTLKVLQNTVVIGDPLAAFSHYLGSAFTSSVTR